MRGALSARLEALRVGSQDALLVGKRAFGRQHVDIGSLGEPIQQLERDHLYLRHDHRIEVTVLQIPAETRPVRQSDAGAAGFQNVLERSAYKEIPPKLIDMNQNVGAVAVGGTHGAAFLGLTPVFR